MGGELRQRICPANDHSPRRYPHLQQYCIRLPVEHDNRNKWGERNTGYHSISPSHDGSITFVRTKPEKLVRLTLRPQGNIKVALRVYLVHISSLHCVRDSNQLVHTVCRYLVTA